MTCTNNQVAQRLRRPPQWNQSCVQRSERIDSAVERLIAHWICLVSHTVCFPHSGSFETCADAERAVGY